MHVQLSASPMSDPFQELSRLVLRHRAALSRVAAGQGLSPEDALECVQDALCTWLVQRQRVPEPAQAHALETLKHMVKNAARNRRRRHHRLRAHLPIDDDAPVPQREPDAEQLVASAESALRLKVCVAQLREVERAVVTLRLLEEHSGEDVAAMLGLSRAHVDVLVHRAKATLRVCMGVTSCPS